MDQVLDKVFDTIISSEQESKQQREYLATLKQKTSLAEKEIKEIERKCLGIQENTARNIKRLGEREVTLLTLRIRQEILQERIRELKQERDMLQRNFKDLVDYLHSLKKEICCAATKFREEFGVNRKHSSKYTATPNMHNYRDSNENLNDAVCFLSDLNKEELQKREHNLEVDVAVSFDVDFYST